MDPERDSDAPVLTIEVYLERQDDDSKYYAPI
jgi:hypothetical protein